MGEKHHFQPNCFKELVVEVTRISNKHIHPGQQGSTRGTGTSGPAEGLYLVSMWSCYIGLGLLPLLFLISRVDSQHKEETAVSNGCSVREG